MKRILSGIQPTNTLNLGNYLGAVKNWVTLQHEYETFLFIADLHSLTVPPAPGVLHHNIRELAATYIACGIDPQNCAIFPQSHVPAHAELAWILSCQTPMGWLNRMTQFKEKAGKDKEQANLGLYAYPVLMAADILLYQATHVPVGHDQKQHLELARDIAMSFNSRFGDFFTVPEPLILGEATRIMSLRDGTKKMSKSDPSDASRINLTDDAETISQKIKKAKSDTEVLPDNLDDLKARPEADNLVAIFAALSGTTKAAVLHDYAGKGFGVFKPALAELTVSVLSPISIRLHELMQDKAALDELLANGAERARAVADITCRKAKELVGLLV